MDNPQVGLQNVDLSGGLGGVFASQQLMDAEKQRVAELQSKGLANTYQQLQNERYGQMTPFELQKTEGEAKSLSAAGDIAQGTKEQVMQQKIAEAYKGKSEAELAKVVADADTMVTKITGAKAQYLQAAQQGQGAQAAAKIAQEFGFDLSNPDVMKQIGPILNNPQEFLKVLDGYSQAYQAVGQSTSKHVADMAKQALVNKGHKETAEIAAKASNYSADKHLEAAKARAGSGGANDIIAQVQRGKLSYEKAAVAFEVMASTEQDETVKQQYLGMAKKFAAEALKNKQALQSGKPDVSALGVPTTSVTTGLGNNPTTSDQDLIKKYLK